MANSTNDARDSLASRILPQMTFSDGSEASMTGPPPPMPHYLTGEGRAVKRFAIEGNAMRMSTCEKAMTGGGGTLALTTARALLEHGASGLLLCDISFSPQAVQEIQSLTDDFPSAEVLRIVVDVTDEASLHRAVEHGTTMLGTIDMLICFAGVVACTPAIDTSPQEWRRTLDINTTGAFLSAQAVARNLIATNTAGSIIFIASISAHKTNFPQPQAAYNASKAALLSLNSSLAAEWAVHGIRVNSISPGYMDTVLNEGEGLAEARKVWTERNPMGRMGQPEEVTGAVLLLCSAAGSYMTGMDLRVDGGQCCI